MVIIKNKTLLGVTIPKQSKDDILEKIIKYITNPIGFFHIVSINPEILVIAKDDQYFKKALETAQIKIIDGIGVVVAAQILNIEAGVRYSGVTLMSDLIKIAVDRRLRVLLIGGRHDLALKLAKCYTKMYPEANFKGIQGLKNIKNPGIDEKNAIFHIVADYKPHITLVAFGSPDQELFIERHKKEFSNMVVMGVGGSFDFLSGRIKRAPVFMQKLGLEWFYRLMREPWRWRRQLRLVKFAALVFKEKISLLF